ncbi:hypothetical protein FGG08_001604 [Glutinoglossum americanum]|uniref:Cell cycle inhibitor Nif1 n=1 Tax=Glutinoglossum americanum TaxID=1670608 RepID=A0A9P8L556_9PEZI|nr:hypothetical protein FGG08_001604 [Glutinoglossum americanum]
MSNRPNPMDLRGKSQDSQRSGQPSPRILHQEGEVPPELSPLDAFLAQGRLLAKQLDDSQKDGKRMSRLPPLAIANSLASVRPGYFRSFSVGTALTETETSSEDEDTVLNKPALSTPENRPASMHPRLSGMPAPTSADPMPSLNPTSELSRGRHPPSALFDSSGYYGARREQSPEPIQEEQITTKTGSNRKQRVSPDATHRQPGAIRRGSSKEYSASRGNNANGLAPPKSPLFQQTSSIRPVPADSSDEELPAAMSASFPSAPSRQPSSSSLMSGSTSSLSPSALMPPRSPSNSSEYSVGGTRMPRTPYNFSRPMSRASRPSFDIPSRQTSSDSQPYMFVDDTVHTPVSMNSEDYTEKVENNVGPAPSYIYSRFSLPRGRALQRNSLIFQDPGQASLFTWDVPPVPQRSVTPTKSNIIYRPPSPPSPTRPGTTPAPTKAMNELRPASSNRLSPSRSLPTSRNASPSRNSGTHISSPSVASSSTVKPHTIGTSSLDMSPDDHVTKGIECHENGAFKESTYHLRLAAKANHPTGMLMYALACRHGWGMRPNQKEGVEWLRKAVDCSSLEVADDEDLEKEGKPTDYMERKTRKAQLALSTYELGVSHMNGWGIEQDKALALRCFEIAGAWGDGDALAEAGFCYAQGIGCKKDLKKAAKFYRQAESKGMSMVGNSWIYKSKYLDEDEKRGRSSSNNESQGKPKRDKSKTRSIFSRKKSVATS